jgi:aspartate carbamoyltransferase catalytic subunit
MKKVKEMKEDSCIIHPLPRRDELPIEIDTDHRAKYWEAVYRGKIIRIALILYMFGFGDVEALRKKAEELKA